MQLSDRTGSRMKLQDLHVLMTVVQAGSMGRAAQILNSTQPNVSRSIGELERTLGVRLLDRHPHGIEPTEYGRALLECGVTVFDDLRQGVKAIEFLADATAGELRIGTTTFLAASFVSAVIDRLSRRYPRMLFHVTSGYMGALHKELAERKVDLLVVRSPGGAEDPQFCFERLFDESYVVVSGAQNPWARRRRVGIKDLANEPWVLPPADSVIGGIIAEAFRGSGLSAPQPAVVTDCPHMRVSLLATGRFVTVFPASSFKFLAKRSELKVLPIDLPAARRPNGIVTLKNRATNPVAQIFIECARKVAEPLAGKAA
ncbi:MAG: LysR family transcriptional regulator [Pseudolabrys sp.]